LTVDGKQEHLRSRNK